MVGVGPDVSINAGATPLVLTLTGGNTTRLIFSGPVTATSGLTIDGKMTSTFAGVYLNSIPQGSLAGPVVLTGSQANLIMLGTAAADNWMVSTLTTATGTDQATRCTESHRVPFPIALPCRG